MGLVRRAKRDYSKTPKFQDWSENRRSIKELLQRKKIVGIKKERDALIVKHNLKVKETSGAPLIVLCAWTKKYETKGGSWETIPAKDMKRIEQLCKSGVLEITHSISPEAMKKMEETM
jgi:hypothetical protein